MAEETTVNRGEQEDWCKRWQAETVAKLEDIVERRRKVPQEELAGPQNYWDIFAIGPIQTPLGPQFRHDKRPSRIIELGEKASVLVVVFFNPFYPPPPAIDACTDLTTHNDKIEIDIFTSNMQTMKPALDLTYTCCIPTTVGQCWYTCCWTFEPKEAACLYEMNICARICNCKNQPLPRYSGFVRWVEDIDSDMFFGGRGWEHDRPIRFMVSDPKHVCLCKTEY